jgi:hypothetical protein
LYALLKKRRKIHHLWQTGRYTAPTNRQTTDYEIWKMTLSSYTWTSFRHLILRAQELAEIAPDFNLQESAEVGSP